MIEMSATQALMELTTVLRNDYITKVTGIRTTSVSSRCSAMKNGEDPPHTMRPGSAQRIRNGMETAARTLRDLADYIPPSHNLDNAEEVRDQLKEILRVVKGGVLYALLGYDTKRWSERVSLTLRKGRRQKSYFFKPEELEKIRDFLYSTAGGYDMWHVVDDGN